MTRPLVFLLVVVLLTAFSGTNVSPKGLGVSAEVGDEGSSSNAWLHKLLFKQRTAHSASKEEKRRLEPVDFAALDSLPSLASDGQRRKASTLPRFVEDRAQGMERGVDVG